MATIEHDVNAAPFTVGDYVMVRCIVTSITGNGGAGDTVNLTVETPGNPGEQSGVTLGVSPVQCRRAGDSKQA